MKQEQFVLLIISPLLKNKLNKGFRNVILNMRHGKA